MQHTTFSRDYNLLVDYAARCLNNNGILRLNTIEPAELVSDAFIQMGELIYSFDAAKKVISKLASAAQKGAKVNTVSLTWDAAEGPQSFIKDNLIDLLEEKTCTICKQHQSTYYFRATGYNTYHSYCKACESLYQRETRAICNLLKKGIPFEAIKELPNFVTAKIRATEPKARLTPAQKLKKEKAERHHKMKVDWLRDQARNLTDYYLKHQLVKNKKLALTLESIEANPELLIKYRKYVQGRRDKLTTPEHRELAAFFNSHNQRRIALDLKDPAQRREYFRKYMREMKEKLTDAYVRSVLKTKHTMKELKERPELVEEKRKELLALRTIEQQNIQRREQKQGQQPKVRNTIIIPISSFIPQYA